MPDLKKLARSALVSSSPWLLAALVFLWMISALNDRVNDAAYAYPRSVITYGLADSKTDIEVILTVEQWKQDAWGAQIGALRVLCDEDFSFITSIVSEDTAVRVCRIVQ